MRHQNKSAICVTQLFYTGVMRIEIIGGLCDDWVDSLCEQLIFHDINALRACTELPDEMCLCEGSAGERGYTKIMLNFPGNRVKIVVKQKPTPTSAKVKPVHGTVFVQDMANADASAAAIRALCSPTQFQQPYVIIGVNVPQCPFAPTALKVSKQELDFYKERIRQLALLRTEACKGTFEAVPKSPVAIASAIMTLINVCH